MTKFNKWGDRNAKPQYFDKEKIQITKGGKTYNVYDSIQAANVDTDIYEVMKKYHCLEEEAIQIMNEKGGEKGVFADIRNLQKQIHDMGDVQRIAQEAKTMFEQLPAEIKQKYGNNLEAFLQKHQEEEQKEKQKEEINNETK